MSPSYVTDKSSTYRQSSPGQVWMGLLFAEGKQHNETFDPETGMT